MLQIHNSKCVVKCYIKRQFGCGHEMLLLGSFNFFLPDSEPPLYTDGLQYFICLKCAPEEGDVMSGAK